MTALTVGVTTARDPICKRGLAVNLAASLARDDARQLRVCVIDADPLNLDVTTRLAVRGPLLEDFAEAAVPSLSALGSVREPPLWVLPSAGAGVGLTRRGLEIALPRLREDFDVIICDLVGGPSGPGAVGGRLDQLDWLLVAVTPESEPVQDAAELLEVFHEAQHRDDIAGAVGIGIVTTGDEGSTEIGPDALGATLGDAVLGAVHQLWGRAAPNLGFGAALGIDELDLAVDALFDRLGAAAVGASFSRSS